MKKDTLPTESSTKKLIAVFLHGLHYNLPFVILVLFAKVTLLFQTTKSVDKFMDENEVLPFGVEAT